MPQPIDSQPPASAGASRRSFLWSTAAIASGAAVVAGCTPAVPVVPSAAPAAPRPTGGETAATSAPAATSLTSRRALGALEVSAVGLGCQTMTGALYGPVSSREDMLTVIRTAADQGVTLFDTAEAYGPFESERIVGEALESIRDGVVIASKFGWDIDPATGQQRGGLNSRPEQIRSAVDGMLERLRTDRIDLLYQHRVDPRVPIEEVAGVVGELMREGKVLHWGLSEPGPQTVRRAHAEQPLSAIQNEYSMLWRGPEEEIIPLCEELGIGLVCWAPLAYGVTTGTINPYTRFAPGDFRAMVPRHSSENLAANMRIVQLLLDWSVSKGATPAQLSLAWLMAQRPWVVPIPSATRIGHLLENIGAEECELGADELAQLTAELDAIGVSGDRLPAPVMAMSGVEAPGA